MYVLGGVSWPFYEAAIPWRAFIQREREREGGGGGGGGGWDWAADQVSA